MKIGIPRYPDFWGLSGHSLFLLMLNDYQSGWHLIIKDDNRGSGYTFQQKRF